MIQTTNCVSLSEFEVRLQSEIWPQSRGVLRADFVPKAVKVNESLSKDRLRKVE